MQLPDFIDEKRDEIVNAWTDAVRRTLAPSMTRVVLIDHMPGFLDELSETLRRSVRASTPGAKPPSAPTARQHGLQRLHLGFNLESLVREYGILRRSILELARKEGVAITHDELDVLVECLISGIADAVTQYTEEREAELRRQANEHFAFVAHELRNPLSNALMAFKSLRDAKLVPENRRVEMLDRSLQRLHSLIEQSLGLAFLGSRIELQRKRFSVRGLIDEAIIDAAAVAEARTVTFDVQQSGNADEVNVDHRLALSAITNLVRNAAKFTHEQSAVHIRWSGNANDMNIEIEDACGGLPAGKADSLFAPFHQAGQDRTGFGLGLAIARQAAEAHGGGIQVRDLPGKGCVFTLKLPRE